jgi:hypothetical protein
MIDHTSEIVTIAFSAGEWRDAPAFTCTFEGADIAGARWTMRHQASPTAGCPEPLTAADVGTRTKEYTLLVECWR